MKNNQIIIAYGFTQEEATAAHRHLISTMGCAPENITIITDPTVIYTQQASQINLVGVKAHATDQKQWSKLMPVCRYMKENNIKFQIIK
jgi:hypothetical protein